MSDPGFVSDDDEITDPAAYLEYARKRKKSFEELTRKAQDRTKDRADAEKPQEYVTVLDEAINLAQPFSLFDEKIIDPDRWFNLQKGSWKDKLAEIQYWIINNPDHELTGEIVHKNNEVKRLIKARFHNADAHKEYQKDVGKRVTALKRTDERERWKVKTIPDDEWFGTTKVGGNPVSNYRNIQLAIVRLPAKITYDTFEDVFHVEINNQSVTFNSKQIRGYLLAPISAEWGFEPLKSHFEDAIEIIRNDPDNQFDSLIQYLDGFEAHYDPDFLAVDEMIPIFDCEDGELNRETIRSMLLGHVQRAYFPGCELQREINIIGGEWTGKSTFCKMLAGNLDIDFSGNAGLKSLARYSNKTIINPLMSDRDRYSACIGVNVFEYDERKRTEQN
jgi:hypothetical protein